MLSEDYLLCVIIEPYLIFHVDGVDAVYIGFGGRKRVATQLLTFGIGIKTLTFHKNCAKIDLSSRHNSPPLRKPYTFEGKGSIQGRKAQAS